MRLTLRLVLVCAAILIAGCGHPEYVKNGEEASEKEQTDYLECLYEAQKATGNLSEEKDDRNDRIEEMIDNCMQLKGYVED